MTAKKNPLQQDVMAMMADKTVLPQLIAEQTESLLKAQTELLEGFEEIASDFLDRRRVDNESAIKAAEKMYGSGDVNDMLVAYFDWLGGAVRRLTEDAAAIGEKAFSVAASAAKAGRNGASMAKPKAKPQPKRKAKPKRKAAGPAQPVVQQVPAAQATMTKQRLAG
jgi:hypothetical protein